MSRTGALIGRDSSGGRRSREDSSGVVRKEKRDDSLAKRRFKPAQSSMVATNNSISDVGGGGGGRGMVAADEMPSAHVRLLPDSTTCESPALIRQRDSNHIIEMLMDGMMSDNVETQLQSLHLVRKQLCGESLGQIIDPPFELVVNKGAVGCFVRFLKTDSEELQFEAAWALTNIASSTFTKAVVDAKAIPHLVNLLGSPNMHIREQCAWCLANISGEDPKYRDAILKHGGIEKLVCAVQSDSCVKKYLETIIWALSNFCRGKPVPTLDKIMPAIQVFGHIILNCPFTDIVQDAIWGLSYITEDSDVNIDMVVNLMDQKLTKKTIGLLLEGSQQYCLPLLKLLGNIAAGNDWHTEALLQNNFLDALIPYLSNPKQLYRREACWIISNIAAGTEHQASKLVNHPNAVAGIINLMQRSCAWEIRVEVRWVVFNILNKKKIYLTAPLIQQGVVELLFDNICEADNKFVLDSLLCLERLFETLGPDGIDRIRRDRIDCVNGIDRLETLQEHSDDKIYQKAVHILERYFDAKEEQDSSSSLAPVVNSAGSVFQFGFAAPVTAASAPLHTQKMHGYSSDMKGGIHQGLAVNQAHANIDQSRQGNALIFDKF